MCYRMQKVVQLICVAIAASALQIAHGGTIDVDTIVDSPLQDVVVVDGLSPPTHVTVVPGGAIVGATIAIDAYDSSIIQFQSGELLSGDIGLRLNDRSRAFVSGGQFNILGPFAEAYDKSYLEITGGRYIETIRLFDNSRLRYVDGTQEMLGSVRAADSSLARIEGGLGLAKLGGLHGSEHSRIVMLDGQTEAITLRDSARLDLLGGSIIAFFEATGESVVNWRGGTLNQDEFLNVTDNAIVHVYGTNLRFETHPEFGDRVLGEFVNERSFAIRYRLFDQGQIILHEVPEPGAVGLLAAGAAALFCWRRAHVVATRRYHK